MCACVHGELYVHVFMVQTLPSMVEELKKAGVAVKVVPARQAGRGKVGYLPLRGNLRCKRNLKAKDIFEESAIATGCDDVLEMNTSTTQTIHPQPLVASRRGSNARGSTDEVEQGVKEYVNDGSVDDSDEEPVVSNRRKRAYSK
eukprot:GHVU01147723.1.p2 GENE.GHVU01147723.1~~GHVU01147723.1.p2  ORF type:complete len:144 (-),score=17.46 GHVU01147723.1:117-548(-)